MYQPLWKEEGEKKIDKFKRQIKEELMERLKAEKKTPVNNTESESKEEKPKRKKKQKEEKKNWYATSVLRR